MKIFRLLIIVIIVGMAAGMAAAQTVTLSTYYPTPFGNYDQLRLVPRGKLDDPCLIGSMYVNMSNALQYCAKDETTGLGRWGPVTGVWKQNIIDDFNAEIYPYELTKDTPKITRVGIGTKFPFANLQAVNHNYWSQIRAIAYSDVSPNHSGVLQTFHARGTKEAPDSVLDGDVIGIWQSRGWNGTEFKNSAAINMYAVGNWSAANSGSKIQFVTTDAATQAMATRMTIADDGYIGIGTAAPASNLHINGANGGRLILEGNQDNDVGLRILTSGGDGGSWLGPGVTGWRFDARGNTHPVDDFGQNDFLIGYWDDTTWTSSNAIFLDHADSNIAFGGRTGPGSPRLHVAEVGSSAGVMATAYSNTAGHGGILSMRHARGTRSTALQAIQNDDLLGVWFASGYNGTTFIDADGQLQLNFPHGGHISMRAVGDWGAASRGSKIQFATADAATSIEAYRMTIADNGNVGIGENFPAQKLVVKGDGAAINLVDTGVVGDDGVSMYVHDDGSLVLSARARNWNAKHFLIQHDAGAAGGIVGIGTLTPGYKLEVGGADGQVRALGYDYVPSDQRMKKNVRPISGALAKVLQLRGVHFSWKETGEEEIGLVAQDVEKVFPELVTASETTGMKGVKYGNLVAPLVEAVKEQQGMISRQQDRIDRLKKELEALESM